MATQTLLTIVQEILSALNSDEVNSIGDTTESLQVATIVQRKYYDMLARGDLPEQRELFQLDASNDIALPVLMTIPAGVTKLEWVKYFNTNPDSNNQTTGYSYVTLLPIDQFIEQVNRLNPTETIVGTMHFLDKGRTFTFYYQNDRQPMYCTVLSNLSVIFDAYDKTQDDTLQSSKTMCWGQTITPFQLVDSFVPDMDDSQFPLLINEAKSLAFFELKQQMHPKADQEIKRQWSQVQKNKSVAGKPSHFEQLPNFGRVPRTGGYSSGSPLNRWMRTP